MHRMLTAGVLAVGLVALSAPPARADAIDGHWCTPDGMRLTIEGPRITTPGGAQMRGEYDRHGFAYDAPPSEPGGGGRVTMRLMGETMMRVQGRGLDPVWRRCGPPTS